MGWFGGILVFGLLFGGWFCSLGFGVFLIDQKIKNALVLN